MEINLSDHCDRRLVLITHLTMGQDPEVCSYIFSLIDLSQQRKGFRSTQLVATPGSQHECCLNISSHLYPYSVIFKDDSTAQVKEETSGYHKVGNNTKFPNHLLLHIRSCK